MTKRDFFRITIKLFGLYALIITLFNFLPSNIAFVITQFDLLAVFWIIGIAIATILIYVFLIIKTDTLINLLKLDKGFDDDAILLNSLDALAILNIAIIVLSGILLVENIPLFLEYSFLAFTNEVGVKAMNTIPLIQFGAQVDYFTWVLSGINVILGVLILANYNKLAVWIFNRQKNPDH